MASALMKCSPAAKSAAGIIRSAAAAAVRTYLPVAGSDVVVAAARGSQLKCRSLNEGFCSNFPAAPVIQMIKEKELGTLCTPVNVLGPHSLSFQNYNSRSGAVAAISDHRCMTTAANPVESMSQESSAPMADVAPRIKFKRLDKTAKHIMQILDKEAVEEVKSQREIPDVKPGYIIQLKVEVPENKRRITTIKGIVIARRNAGLNTTFRLRRLVAGIGVESLFPLYSPNIKEIRVLEKKKVRRAKLYYLRERMNALRK